MLSPSNKLLPSGEVSKRLGVSKSAIYKWVKDNRFPKPIILGESSSRWFENEVEQWLMERPRGGSDD